MKIWTYLLIVAALLLAAHAHASTAFSFWANTDGTWQCPSYCIGFSTDDPAHSIGSIDVSPGAVVLVGGVWVQSYNYNIFVDGVSHVAHNITRQPFVAGTGTFTVNFTIVVIKQANGHRTTYLHANSGSVLLP